MPATTAEHAGSEGSTTGRMGPKQNEESVIARVSSLVLFANNPPVTQMEFADDALRITLKGKPKNRRVEGTDISVKGGAKVDHVGGSTA